MKTNTNVPNWFTCTPTACVRPSVILDCPKVGLSGSKLLRQRRVRPVFSDAHLCDQWPWGASHYNDRDRRCGLGVRSAVPLLWREVSFAVVQGRRKSTSRANAVEVPPLRPRMSKSGETALKIRGPRVGWSPCRWSVRAPSRVTNCGRPTLVW